MAYLVNFDLQVMHLELNLSLICEHCPKCILDMQQHFEKRTEDGQGCKTVVGHIVMNRMFMVMLQGLARLPSV